MPDESPDADPDPELMDRNGRFFVLPLSVLGWFREDDVFVDEACVFVDDGFSLLRSADAALVSIASKVGNRPVLSSRKLCIRPLTAELSPFQIMS